MPVGDDHLVDADVAPAGHHLGEPLDGPADRRSGRHELHQLGALGVVVGEEHERLGRPDDVRGVTVDLGAFAEADPAAREAAVAAAQGAPGVALEFLDQDFGAVLKAMQAILARALAAANFAGFTDQLAIARQAVRMAWAESFSTGEP